jgi:hypothetical protein
MHFDRSHRRRGGSAAALIAIATLLWAVVVGAETAAPPYTQPPDVPALGGKKIPLPAVPESFNVHDGGWIHFAYPPSDRPAVQPLIAHADALRKELIDRLGVPVLDEVSVYVARTPGEMATLAPPAAPYPKYASGVAYAPLGLVLLSIAPQSPGSRHDLREIFSHELAHVALHDATGGRPVPRWFSEGFAVHASGEGSMVRLQTLWTATLSNHLLPLEQLERDFPSDSLTAQVAYAESADVVRFLLRRQDRDRFTGLIGRLSKGQAFDAALRDAYGLDSITLEYEWREDAKRRYTYWPILFSGGVVWMGIFGVIIWVWRRRRQRARVTLERWAREEAAVDALRTQLELTDQNRRVHLVVARGHRPPPPTALPGSFPETIEVPKVEHKGQWHTLH